MASPTSPQILEMIFANRPTAKHRDGFKFLLRERERERDRKKNYDKKIP